MIDLELIHSVTIRRRTETIVSQQVSFGADATVATGVACLVQPASDSLSVGPMGIGQRETFDVLFLAGTDVRENDLLDWTDSVDATAKVLVVRAVSRPRDNMFGAGLESFVSVSAQLREVA